MTTSAPGLPTISITAAEFQQVEGDIANNDTDNVPTNVLQRANYVDGNIVDAALRTCQDFEAGHDYASMTSDVAGYVQRDNAQFGLSLTAYDTSVIEMEAVHDICPQFSGELP